jgi:hypothetical protein
MKLILSLMTYHYAQFADGQGNTRNAYSRFLYSIFFLFSLNILACLNYIYLFNNLKLRFYLIILILLYSAFFTLFVKVLNYNRLHYEYGIKHSSSDFNPLIDFLIGLLSYLTHLLSLIHLVISCAILSEKGPIYKILVWCFS